jgi:uncharacterized lipoprotein YddW (UPF0748 family)
MTNHIPAFSRLFPVLLSSLAGCAVLAAAPAQMAGDPSPPAVLREFRGLWVATVDNIDWPSQRGLDSTRQKQELLALLDRAAALRFNVVILQVRPCCDAFYASKIEPWSEYLTGHGGQAPNPLYDPLLFAVEEAHKRGLALHAWFNPYRARYGEPKTPAAPNHVSFTHPELVRAYGKSLWLDPSEQGTRDYSLSVVMDVVRGYDIDGVHFDDYFYPDPATADGQEFPDDLSWRRYLAQGGKMTRADWRRDNVNRFVQAVYQAIKKVKPWVQFGVSPAGIWRSAHPPQISGFAAYDQIYCDARKWLEEGWLDYCAPQLYWPIDKKAQSFPVLLQWWAAQNTRPRTLLAGMKVNDWKDPSVTDDAREAAREIELTRRQPRLSGEILWHAKPLLRKGNSVADILENQIYAAPALVPASPWLSTNAPGQPVLQAAWTGGELRLNWRTNGGAVWLWVLQKKSGGHWSAEILPGAKTSATLKPGPGKAAPAAVALFAVDRFGNLSSGATYRKAP